MEIYAEQWSEDDADETEGVSPAPFGDYTWRVVDESVGGVIAYFNNQADADGYAIAKRRI